MPERSAHPLTPSPTLRPACPTDYATLLKLTLNGLGASELAGQVGPDDVHPIHELASKLGSVLVAELDGAIAGYASVIEDDGVRILSQLFVDETLRSRGVGRQLLAAIDPQDDSPRLLQASADPRALGLYIRRGYIPAWPVYALDLTAAQFAGLPAAGGEARLVAPGPELAELDRTVSGRGRPQVHAYWSERTGGIPYLIHGDDGPAGFGWLHDPLSGAMSKWYESGAPLTIGPVGALPGADSWKVLLALLDTVRRTYPGRGASIEIPGPHPALPHLLRAGARIVDAETAMATDVSLLADPERYIPSGGILY